MLPPRLFAASLPLLCSTTLAAAGQSIASQDPTPIVGGVTRLWTNGVVGPLTAIPGSGVRALVSGDEDASAPGVFAVTSGLGKGRVVAVGHTGIFHDEANKVYDTLRFNTQALGWLDVNKTKTIALLSGHREWTSLARMAILRAKLGLLGYTVRGLAGSLSAAKLKGVGVVIVGGAWGAFTTAELAALDAWSRAGGGLYLSGLGWSWRPYNKGKTLDDYPMNVLGLKFGIRWIEGTIQDPTNTYKNAPIFHTFYPSCGPRLPEQGLATLDKHCSAHATDLDAWLRGSRAAQVDFLLAMGATVTGLTGLPDRLKERTTFDTGARKVFAKHTRWFEMAPRYSSHADPVLANARAAFDLGLFSALPFDARRKATLTALLGLARVDADYQRLFKRFDVLLLDNRSLNREQRTYLLDLLAQATSVDHRLRVITVLGALGKASPTLFHAHGGAAFAEPSVGRVNIFGVGMWRRENGWPPDVAPLRRPTYCAAAAHELAHVLDARMSAKSSAYASRRAKLIADAGTDNLQYLRSMFGSFFLQAPQEFVASIANQWFLDSVHTLRLGLVRLDAGKAQPILQALFILDLLGQGKATVPLLTTSYDGKLGVVQASVRRDAVGRPIRLSAGTAKLDLVYDAAGRVKSYRSALVYGEPSPQLGASLTASAAPRLGDAGFAFAGATKAARQQGLLLVGTSPDDWPLPAPLFEGRLHVRLDRALVLPFLSDGAASYHVPLAIPNLALLDGQRVYAQALAAGLDAAGRLLIGASAGVEARIGR